MRKYSSIWLGLLIICSISVLSAYLLVNEDGTSNKNMARANSLNKNAETDGRAKVTTDNGRTALANIPQVLPIPEHLFFAGEHVPLDDPDVLERFEKELYITAHRYYQVIFYLKRTPRVFPQLRKALQNEGMPEDFLYLAVIESDLIPTIESPAGAKGIWQFMPSTAQRYGLRVDRRIDERMHIEKSTQAAIDFLKNAKKKTGSWTMACAAYNMGLARTLRTMRAQDSDNYYKLYINDETSRYVFKILAAKVIIENPEIYGYDIPAVEGYSLQPYEELKVTDGIDNLVDWAKRHNTTYYDLKKLNPWILQRYLPKGSFTIKVPVD